MVLFLFFFLNKLCHYTHSLSLSIKWQVRLSDFDRWKPIETTAGNVLSLVWRGCVAAREAEEEMGRQVREDWNVCFSHTWEEHTYQTWPFPFHWLIWSWLTAQTTNKSPLFATEGVWPMIPNCEPIARQGWLADRWGGEEIKLICGVCLHSGILTDCEVVLYHANLLPQNDGLWKTDLDSPWSKATGKMTW